MVKQVNNNVLKMLRVLVLNKCKIMFSERAIPTPTLFSLVRIACCRLVSLVCFSTNQNVVGWFPVENKNRRKSLYKMKKHQFPYSRRLVIFFVQTKNSSLTVEVVAFVRIWYLVFCGEGEGDNGIVGSFPLFECTIPSIV